MHAGGYFSPADHEAKRSWSFEPPSPEDPVGLVTLKVEERARIRKGDARVRREKLRTRELFRRCSDSFAIQRHLDPLSSEWHGAG